MNESIPAQIIEQLPTPVAPPPIPTPAAVAAVVHDSAFQFYSWPVFLLFFVLGVATTALVIYYLRREEKDVLTPIKDKYEELNKLYGECVHDIKFCRKKYEEILLTPNKSLEVSDTMVLFNGKLDELWKTFHSLQRDEWSIAKDLGSRMRKIEDSSLRDFLSLAEQIKGDNREALKGFNDRLLDLEFKQQRKKKPRALLPKGPKEPPVYEPNLGGGA